MEVVASLSQGRTVAAQCGLFTYKSVPVIFELSCILHYSINILNLYVHMCISLPTSVRLIGVHALLKIKIRLQPFSVSSCSSEAKL